MRHLIRIGALLSLLVAVQAPAAIINGNAGDTFLLSALIGNTLVVQDKTFSNFAYTDVGGANDPATTVQGTVLFATPASNVDDHGFLWKKTGATAAWQDNFNLSYTIAVSPGFPNVSIFASKDVIDTSLIPNGDTLVDTQTSPLPGPAIVQALNLNGASTANESLQISWAPERKQIDTSAVVTNANHQFTSLEQHFFEHTAVIPEPGTMLLLGSGLLGLAGFARKREKK